MGRRSRHSAPNAWALIRIPENARLRCVRSTRSGGRFCWRMERGNPRKVSQFLQDGADVVRQGAPGAGRAAVKMAGWRRVEIRKRAPWISGVRFGEVGGRLTL